MIYLQRHTIDAEGCEIVDIAVVEHELHAERYEALGYVRCSAAAFCEAWRQRDARSLAQLRAGLGATATVAAPAAQARGIYNTLG
jgi:hypothetical protein